MSRKNQNLSREESAALRDTALQLGLTASRGPHAKDGSAVALQLAIISGQVAPIMVTGDVIAALTWLAEARGMCFDEGAQRGLDSLIAALWAAKNRQKGNEQ